MSVFKDTDFKELDGYLKLGLGDYAKTARIMGWIWSFNAIANTFGEPLHLKGEDKEKGWIPHGKFSLNFDNGPQLVSFYLTTFFPSMM